MNRFTQFFSGGQWHASSGAELVGVFNPATEEQVAMVRLCSTQDVDAAVLAAAQAFALWSGSNLVQRKDALGRLSKAVEVRQQSFIASFALEAGCPAWCGRELQGRLPHQMFESTLRAIDQVRWREDVEGSQVRREPVGVVAGITTWSAPLLQMVAKVAAAIAAGCSIVLKPSQATPGTVRLFCDAIEECDLIPGLVNVLHGGPALGEALVSHAGVAMVSFTGSAAVGRQVAALAAQTGKRTNLQLGGKSAALLLDDADIDAALASVLRSCMTHSGQDCAAQSRLVVPRSQLARVTDALHEQLTDWKLGPPQNDTTRIGPLFSMDQFTRVNTAIAEAIDAGAGLLAGGPGRAPGFEAGHFVAPTVLTATPDMAVAQQELFGPVLCLLAHDSDHDAVRIANATPYGLSGAVWSRDPARAQKVALRMRAGEVLVNGAARNLAAPFGGFGASGHGREHGRFGIVAFLDTKSIEGLA
ncbi:MAG: aldehyde dehydrogenase family protein [Rhizobacter sp.]|nr:aldehyde dehydrogenase family protein [Rhizobacter sp.]